MTIQIVILAAGCGKRMCSNLPKMLHHLAGKPLLEHIIQTALTITPHLSPIVVYGHQGEKLKSALAHYPVIWIEQKEQLGTGHALLQVLPALEDIEQVLVLAGDVPLISVSTLQSLIKATPKNSIGMITAHLSHPFGYGRIKRDAKNEVIQIIEEKDATAAEQAMTEINAGIYIIPEIFLKKWLPMITNHNAQKEYYLTDIVAEAVRDHISLVTVEPAQYQEILGVNDRVQLAHLERFYQWQQAEKWMRAGVTILDPARFDVRGDIQIGRDVTIDINVILEGRVVIGDHCTIGPNTILRNVVLSPGVEIKANCILDGAEIGNESLIGPFARLRPGTILASNVHIGNFVEIKNSDIGQASKVNHLSYVGDSDVGRHVNLGAGTITCNYDGVNKHRTIIGDGAHIGSDTQLVAPVTVGEGAMIGAGSTLTKNAPPHQLTLTHRLEQRSCPYQPPEKVADNLLKNN